ncbi:hypothetical protein CJD35_13645 [Sphingobium xenophagum]|uniref:Phage P22-like portal protein n=1 Tax=Sphingobium xenophagum TaxID=121428 RepID=A0A249MW44_SPHXE|nr:portal protein [Sphingobium xenophagum]ASY45359.1 hypothetical protein CJD35_13645 [Sphingobium xenophagum]
MEHDTALEQDKAAENSERLRKVHERALKRFDATAVPQMEMRAESLLSRRFIAIPGAMWEGPWGEQFENSIKVEIDKVSRGVDKIVIDYRENRIVPDFRPAGGESDQDTADTLDGIHRADDHFFKAQEARDNAFEEAVVGGFGAYRLTNEYEDPYDKDSDAQRINPAMLIADADQRVFFDINAKRYDKRDARFGFVLTAYSREAFEEEYGEGCATDWPENRLTLQYCWFQPDMVIVAEYYEKQDKDETLYVLTHPLLDDEERFWSSEIDDDELADRKAQGWTVKSRRRKRCRIMKYTLSGAEVLVEHGPIAGDRIPVVPVYGKRSFVDNMERFRGHVSKRMDAQRIYNAKVSKLAETDSLSPNETPIFTPDQIAGHETMWEEANINRSPYLLVNPLIDESTGQVIQTGAVDRVNPPTLAPVTAALLQIASGDLTEDDQDVDQVKANTSAEAMDIAATRIDAKSGIYIDNMRRSVECEAEIYLGMAREVYYEPGREVETMDEEGGDGVAILHEQFTDKNGVFRIRNDIARGKYKVVGSVTEATATRRDKTVKSCLNTATVAQAAGDAELATVATLTAVMNQDGEGMTSMQRYARKRLVAMGVEEPNEEEQRQMEEAAQNQQPDATQAALMAQAQEFEASAALKGAQAQKAMADTKLSGAKAVETLASAAQKAAQTGQTVRETQLVGMEAANANDAEPRGGDLASRSAGDRPRIALGRDLPADAA